LYRHSGESPRSCLRIRFIVGIVHDLVKQTHSETTSGLTDRGKVITLGNDSKFEKSIQTRQCPSLPRQEGAREQSIQHLIAERASFYLFISLSNASRSPPLMPAMYFTSLFLASMSYWLVIAICSMTGEPPPW